MGGSLPSNHFGQIFVNAVNRSNDLKIAKDYHMCTRRLPEGFIKSLDFIFLKLVSCKVDHERSNGFHVPPYTSPCMHMPKKSLEAVQILVDTKFV